MCEKRVRATPFSNARVVARETEEKRKRAFFFFFGIKIIKKAVKMEIESKYEFVCAIHCVYCALINITIFFLLQVGAFEEPPAR